ncbi:uncharacterized protein BO66DRAFT_128655 [Aspergillus aculeatinus CBS 121060]|uniref:Uncharacterized protein n=1 Tax=Aspergillus aculeatinus CBS 121060 TaxID=1448322 RepID=A0ACD1H493_9EURO|nr:hypothetical protein BO66DRAFT_128655 [Aspergillus aculeatinus CBS 121060]RAH68393.1 hypothetical protein BO66DRAFT_128655 [Aspergillus aculeatinus CBS 121060]
MDDDNGNDVWDLSIVLFRSMPEDKLSVVMDWKNTLQSVYWQHWSCHDLYIAILQLSRMRAGNHVFEQFNLASLSIPREMYAIKGTVPCMNPCAQHRERPHPENHRRTIGSPSVPKRWQSQEKLVQCAACTNPDHQGHTHTADMTSGPPVEEISDRSTARGDAELSRSLAELDVQCIVVWCPDGANHEFSVGWLRDRQQLIIP